MIAQCNNVPSSHSSKTLIIINSYMIALVLLAEFIAIVLGALFHLTDILPYIFICTVLMSYITAVFARYEYRINTLALFLFLYSFLLFFFSITVNGPGTNIKYLLNFSTYGIVSFLLLMLPFSTKIILRVTSSAAVLYLLFSTQIKSFISINVESYGRINMFSSYAISTIIIASIVYLFFYSKSLRWFDIIIYFSNIHLLFLLLFQGTRGSILELFILFLFILWKKMGDVSAKKEFIKKYIYLAGILVIGVSVLVLFDQILIVIYGTLQALGINVSVINKSYSLISSQGSGLGVLNGRDTVFSEAFKVFSESPIIGIGIGKYEDLFQTWPHNVFLQLLSEQGILFSIPFFYIIGIGVASVLRSWKFNETKEMGIFLLFLFIVSIPRLMLSSYFWKEQTFWMFVIVTCLFIQLVKKYSY